MEQNSPLPMENKSQRLWMVASAIFLFNVVLVTFINVRHFDFLHWDDNDYIERNELIGDLGFTNIGKMFTEFYAGNWHPITWLSHAIDIKLYGFNPAGHHVTNLIIHGFNAILVFVLTLTILKILSRNNEQFYSQEKIVILTALLASLWFAVHPLRIESFAWISERKDVLCALFYLLSVIFYLYRFRFPAYSLKLYWASFLIFIFAVMSKGMAVTLPVVLILLDLIPNVRVPQENYRWKEVILSKKLQCFFFEKIPFFVVSIMAGLLIILAQQDAGAIKSISSVNLDVRLLNAINSVFVYISKTIFPLHLLPIYPYPEHVMTLNVVSLSQSVGLVLFVTFCIYQAGKGKPILLLIVLIYLTLLSPVLGILQVGEQPYADRYSYLPTIPLFISVACIMANLHFLQKRVSGPTYKWILPITMVIFLIALSFVRSQSYLPVWRNDISIWSYVINNSVRPAVVAYNNLGARLKDEKQFDQAETVLKMGIKSYPENGALYNNLRSLYQESGKYNEAIFFVENISKTNGGSAIYLADKVHFLILQNKYEQAIKLLQTGMKKYSDSIQLKYQYAFCMAKTGKNKKALLQLDMILKQSPNNKLAILLKKELTGLSDQ